MDTSYRRRTRERTRERTHNSRKRPPADAADWRAIVLLQCIVSGMALCLLLLISLVNTKFTDDLRNNLKLAISGSTTFDEVKDNAAEATSVFFNVQDDFKSLFGNGTEAPTQPADTDTPYAEEKPEDSEEAGSFRIDEDILEEMTNRKDPYTNDFF